MVFSKLLKGLFLLTIGFKFFLCSKSTKSTDLDSPEVVYAFDVIDYAWTDFDEKSRATQNGSYIPENNIITGIKIWDDIVYVTVPRWRPGVPATLNRIITTGNSTLLEPYPNWAMNRLENNPGGLKYVQSMEIDSRGFMWILDVGRLNLLDTTNLVNGPPKLVIWDITRNCLIREFVFPNHVLPWNNSFANDLVVDETNGLAYITDTWAKGGLVVYDLNTNLARRFDHHSLEGNSSATFPINGVIYNLGSPSDGIALSHDTKTVYYCCVSTPWLFSVPAEKLANFSLTDAEIGAWVINHGFKGFSDGLAATADDRLFWGRNAIDAVWAAPLSSLTQTNKANRAEKLFKMAGGQLGSQVAQNEFLDMWIDTFAFDQKGSIFWTANSLPLYITKTMDFDHPKYPNMRIWRQNIGTDSYLTKNPVPPTMTCQI